MKLCALSLWFSSLRLSTLVLFPAISAHRNCSLSVAGTWGFRPSQKCWMFLRLGSVCFRFSCWWCGESLRACFILHRGGLWEEGVKADAPSTVCFALCIDVCDITQWPVYIRSVSLWKVIWIKLYMCLQLKAHENIASLVFKKWVPCKESVIFECLWCQVWKPLPCLSICIHWCYFCPSGRGWQHSHSGVRKPPPGASA